MTKYIPYLRSTTCNWLFFDTMNAQKNKLKTLFASMKRKLHAFYYRVANLTISQRIAVSVLLISFVNKRPAS